MDDAWSSMIVRRCVIRMDQGDTMMLVIECEQADLIALVHSRGTKNRLVPLLHRRHLGCLDAAV
jgi:hypothetical protein